MKIKLDLSPDTEISVEKDDDGNVLSLTLVPSFAKRNGHAVLAYGVATSETGKLLDRFALNVSGGTGKVSKTGRVVAVKAAVDEALNVEDTDTQEDKQDE